jgi:hypothetical protein
LKIKRRIKKFLNNIWYQSAILTLTLLIALGIGGLQIFLVNRQNQIAEEQNKIADKQTKIDSVQTVISKSFFDMNCIPKFHIGISQSQKSSDNRSWDLFFENFGDYYFYICDIIYDKHKESYKILVYPSEIKIVETGVIRYFESKVQKENKSGLKSYKYRFEVIIESINHNKFKVLCYIEIEASYNSICEVIFDHKDVSPLE